MQVRRPGPVRVREARSGVIWRCSSRGVTYRDAKYTVNLMSILTLRFIPDLLMAQH